MQMVTMVPGQGGGFNQCASPDKMTWVHPFWNHKQCLTSTMEMETSVTTLSIFFPHLCLIMSYWEVGTMSLKPDHNLFLGNTLRPSLTALTYGNRGVTWAKRASILNSHSKLAGKDEGDTTKMNVICAQNKYFKCQEIKFQIEIFH